MSYAFIYISIFKAKFESYIQSSKLVSYGPVEPGTLLTVQNYQRCVKCILNITFNRFKEGFSSFVNKRSFKMKLKKMFFIQIIQGQHCLPITILFPSSCLFSSRLEISGTCAWTLRGYFHAELEKIEKEIKHSWASLCY